MQNAPVERVVGLAGTDGLSVLNRACESASCGLKFALQRQTTGSLPIVVQPPQPANQLISHGFSGIW